jgi:hypothetical protein
MKRQMPYALCNFEKIVRDKYYFVDKTHFIQELEKVNYPVFLRPRRFGKSLFTQILKWYYDTDAKDRFQELFGHLYIGKNPTRLHNTYFFLDMDFSGMSTYPDKDKDLIKKQFDLKINTYLTGFLRRYGKKLGIDEKYIENFQKNYAIDACAGLEKIIALTGENKGKIFITIDEYDSLTNSLALMYKEAPKEENLYLELLRKGGFFRNFFETLKNGTKSAVDRIYLTGILPITIADMNSGFNIAQWITFDEKFTNMLGITGREFDELLNEVYRDHNIDLEKNQVKTIISDYYNGYRFLPGKEHVYNPMMTLYFLDQLVNHQKIPDNLLDHNLRTQYDQVSYLFGSNVEQRDSIIEEITEKKEIYFPSTMKITFDMVDFKEGKHITEGLYYLGILTYGDEKGVLVIPNLVTYEMVLTYFQRIKKFELSANRFGKWIKEYLHKGDIEYLIQGFFLEAIVKFPGDFFKDVNESFYRGLLFHLLYNNLFKDQYEVLPEYNLPGGTVDIMVRSFPAAGVRCRLLDLIEIKRVPKGASDREFDGKVHQGKEQMKKYLTGDYKGWRGIVVCFRGNKDYKINILESKA